MRAICIAPMVRHSCLHSLPAGSVPCTPSTSPSSPTAKRAPRGRSCAGATSYLTPSRAGAEAITLAATIFFSSPASKKKAFSGSLSCWLTEISKCCLGADHLHRYWGGLIA